MYPPQFGYAIPGEGFTPDYIFHIVTQARERAFRMESDANSVSSTLIEITNVDRVNALPLDGKDDDPEGENGVILSKDDLRFHPQAFLNYLFIITWNHMKLTSFFPYFSPLPSSLHRIEHMLPSYVVTLVKDLCQRLRYNREDRLNLINHYSQKDDGLRAIIICFILAIEEEEEARFNPLSFPYRAIYDKYLSRTSAELEETYFPGCGRVEGRIILFQVYLELCQIYYPSMASFRFVGSSKFPREDEYRPRSRSI